MFKKGFVFFFFFGGGGGLLVRVLLVKTGFNQNSLFTKISTNVLPLLPSVMSMHNVPILVGLIAADVKLVFLETEKLVKVCEGLCGR